MSMTLTPTATANPLADRALGEPPVEGRSLSETLFEQLSEAIVRGEFAPGQKLSEPRLAARFGVSRGSLREAIRRLEERRLVTRSPRQGVRVVAPNGQKAIELMLMREVLEGLAAREAARRVTPPEVAELRAMLARHRQTLGDPEALVYWQERVDSDFHFAVARFSGNGELCALLCEAYYPLLRLYRMQHRMVPGRARRALLEHERIVEAIADKDSELAELLMRRHIARARQALESGQERESAPTA